MKNIKLNKKIYKNRYILKNKVRTFNSFEYKKYKENKQKAFDKLPIYFAFGEEQFKELLNKLNLTDKPEDLKKLVNVGYGGIMRKCDLFLLESHNETFSNEKLLFWLKNNFQFAYSAFMYEMNNHEFSYTYDIEDTLYALNLNFSDLEKNALLRLAYLRARKDYLKKCNEMEV